MRRYVVGVLLMLGSASGAAQVRTPLKTDHPETVMVTLRAKAGAEAELEAVIARHFTTARGLNLILPDPHMTVRGTDAAGRTYFVDIFSWRDPSVPDSAPPAIQAIWADMNRLVEARNGAPGLEFSEVTVLRYDRRDGPGTDAAGARVDRPVSGGVTNGDARCALPGCDAAGAAGDVDPRRRIPARSFRLPLRESVVLQHYRTGAPLF